MTLREITTKTIAPVKKTLSEPPTVERFKGAILGCALGDVVGAWAEARPADEAADYVRHFVAKFDFSKVGNHHRGVPFGQYTDDTQLTRELALSLVDECDWVPQDFADKIAQIFARNGVVGYGRATQEAATRLLDGALWDQAGTPPPRAGNGAAMRAGPVGLFYWNNFGGLLKAATEQAIITHRAPMAVAGSLTIATAVAMCVNASRETSGPHEAGWWAWLAKFVGDGDVSEFVELSQSIQDLSDLVFEGRKKQGRAPGCDEENAEALKFAKEGDDTRWSGVSPWTRSSVLWSLYCVMAHPTDVWKAIQTAVAAGGDTDTTAAMVGAMVGAHVGQDHFPEQVQTIVAPQVHDARAPLWDWDGLGLLATDLHATALKRSERALKTPRDLLVEPSGTKSIDVLDVLDPTGKL
jgi:ADP-ribosylglycohydrolase